MTKVLDQITQIARVCHEANRAYCESIGDQSQMPWDLAPGWQQASARNGVQAIADGYVVYPQDSHEAWMRDKLADGWRYGEVKDEKAKTHHCIVPYEELPAEQRMKDHIFLAIAKAMLRDIG